MKATFTGHAPKRDDGLRQIDKPELSPAEREAIARFTRDIEKHLAKRNRLDTERKAQRELYRRPA